MKRNLHTLQCARPLAGEICIPYSARAPWDSPSLGAVHSGGPSEANFAYLTVRAALGGRQLGVAGEAEPARVHHRARLAARDDADGDEPDRADQRRERRGEDGDDEVRDEVRDQRGGDVQGGREQKNQTLNPLSITLNPLQDDPKKTQNPDTYGSFEGKTLQEMHMLQFQCDMMASRLVKKPNPKPPINFARPLQIRP